MYNKIWSPLKQEFVPTLSEDGKKALKLYVNSFMTGGAERGSPEAAVEEVPADKFYRLFFGDEKTHDLGEIPKAYGKEGVFIADFGSSDLKFLGKKGTEVKYKDGYKEESNYFLSNSPEHISLLNDLFDKRVEWTENVNKTLYIRGGSILKGNSGNEGQRMTNLLEFIKQWNSKEENAQRQIKEEVIIENAQHDLMGRMNKQISVIKTRKGGVSLQKLKGGEHIIIGGPLSYIHPILKFGKHFVQGSLKEKNGPVHTFNETDNTFTDLNDSRDFAKIYYVICYYILKGEELINAESVVFFGPTGSNPTISVLDINTKMVQIYEFPKNNMAKYESKEPKLFRPIQITQDLHPKLFEMLQNEATAQQQGTDGGAGKVERISHLQELEELQGLEEMSLNTPVQNMSSPMSKPSYIRDFTRSGPHSTIEASEADKAGAGASEELAQSAGETATSVQNLADNPKNPVLMRKAGEHLLQLGKKLSESASQQPQAAAAAATGEES